ncbi:MAG: hypothetical protein VST68_08335 [Nitrospirota bacterium]|nr:hypothetical protein [Nitrospirota bacterium]
MPSPIVTTLTSTGQLCNNAPLVKNKSITFDSIETLRKVFQVSCTATAIRLVQLGSFPAMVVCNAKNRRCWFNRGPLVPEELWPVDKPGRDSGACSLFQNPGKNRETYDISADNWINHPDSFKYLLREDSIKISADLVLTLLWWKDERQILDLDDEN